MKCIEWLHIIDNHEFLSDCNKKKIFIGSTDTVLGLMGLVDQCVFNNLQKIKDRDGKPFIILISSYDQLDVFVSVEDRLKLELCVRHMWPCALTCILPLRKSHWLYAMQSTIAIRMPNHDGLLALMHQVGPLFSTSVNTAGMPHASLVADIEEVIKKQIDICVLDAEAMKHSLPSTIVDLTGLKPVVVREGSISAQMLRWD